MHIVSGVRDGAYDIVGQRLLDQQLQYCNDLSLVGDMYVSKRERKRATVSHKSVQHRDDLATRDLVESSLSASESFTIIISNIIFVIHSYILVTRCRSFARTQSLRKTGLHERLSTERRIRYHRITSCRTENRLQRSSTTIKRDPHSSDSRRVKDSTNSREFSSLCRVYIANYIFACFLAMK